MMTFHRKLGHALGGDPRADKDLHTRCRRRRRLVARDSRLFGLYLDHFASYTSIYGALGTAIILLTWFRQLRLSTHAAGTSLALLWDRRHVMSTTAWIVVIVLAVLLFGGGGFFYSRR